ncbi:hypothetical protein MOV61_00735 [Neorhizobium sp. BETTINA12A]|uniref:hypothetical protein n=1 Tax=Neorhizobium sp. BETTINA12A TaxID=2908924 RepID=UPI001FF54138|nr:hypothetical protein [Neorhizobium sp. BETTINA12A]MCJ9749236.1 hypothetical protein [Neorhizobium sp. BETTINA12A]
MDQDDMPPVFPRDLTVYIKLDNDPRYIGTIHDDAVARTRGYKAALIPGAFVYGHISRVALQAWGEAWTRRGGMGARFRRPVYNGDRLLIRAGILEGDGAMRRAQVLVTNEEGEEVASGWVGLPDGAPVVPDISAFAPIPRPAVPSKGDVGSLRPGMSLTTANRVLTQGDFEASLRAFGEGEPFYKREGIVHSGCAMRLAMGDAHNSFRFPSPVVLTEIETQHFAQVRPGQRLATVGQVAQVYQRKGKHYLGTEEFLLADGLLVARFRRTQIYAYDTPGP